MSSSAAFTAKSVMSMPDGRPSDPGCPGLYLWVRGGGKYRAFQHRFQFDGKPFTMSLGPVGKLPLAEARAKVRENQVMINKGVNPAAPDSAKAKAGETTFRQDSLVYYDHVRQTWTREHEKNWLASLEKHVFPTLGDRATTSLTVSDIVNLIKPLHGVLSTSNLILLRIRSVINHAIALADSDDLFQRGNVADKRVTSRLPRGVETPPVPHRSLPWCKAPELWTALLARPEAAAKALRLLLTSGTPRAAEIIGLTWGEVSLGAAVLNIPGARVKARQGEKRGRDKVIPLVKAAVAMLREMRPDDAQPQQRVFPGRGGHMGDEAMLMLLKELGVPSDVHGLRSTYRSWVTANAVSVVDHDAGELALGHVIAGRVARAYDREDLLEERRDLQERWAKFLQS